MGLIARAHGLLLVVAGIYGVFLAALLIPYVQTALIFMHWVKWPLDADFDHPEKYGIALGQVRNFHILTPDGASIGVWHALPHAVYSQYLKRGNGSLALSPGEGNIPTEVFIQSLGKYPTILYSHGNAATRAQGYRTRMLRGVTSWTSPTCDRGVNFVTYDYRGFGDSSSASKFPPTEKGLVTDARAVFDHLVKQGAPSHQIGIVGQSLGTGVSVGLAAQLELDRQEVGMLGLIAPFTSIRELLKTYKLFYFIPILGPLGPFPQVQDYLLKFLIHEFDSVSKLPLINAPILLVHAKDDMDVGYFHSVSLFETLLQSYLETSSSDILDDHDDNGVKNDCDDSDKHLQVKIDSLGEFGMMKTIVKRSQEGFQQQPQQQQLQSQVDSTMSPSISITRQVVWLEANRGGHNLIASSDTVISALAQMICS